MSICKELHPRRINFCITQQITVILKDQITKQPNEDFYDSKTLGFAYSSKRNV